MDQTIVQAELEKISQAKADPEVRVMRRLEIGSVIQQGDVYLHVVPADHPRGQRIGEGQVQIALGEGSGARHVADGDVEVFEGAALPEGFSVPEGAEAEDLLGPLVVARKPWTLTHPEHAHHRAPALTYQVTYQFDPRTMRRVVD